MSENSAIAETAKIAVLGNVDAGKSTLISVLVNNKLDDGRGSARKMITKYKHELDTGRTSTASFHYLVGEPAVTPPTVSNENSNNNSTKNPNESKETSQRSVTTLIDLCGHEKYFKTTLFGVLGLFADYGLVIVGSNMGVVGMTKEHLVLMITNNMPIVIAVTKIDICPPQILKGTKDTICALMRHRQVKRNPILIDTPQDDSDENVKKYLDQFNENIYTNVPVISISSKEDINIKFLRKFLMHMKSQRLVQQFTREISPVTDDMGIMYLDQCYSIRGIGFVFSGTLQGGVFKVGDTVYCGPFESQKINMNSKTKEKYQPDGEYQPLTIRSIHNCIREDVSSLQPEQSGALSVRFTGKKFEFNRHKFRKGLVLAKNLESAKSCTTWYFTANVEIFHHPTTVTNGYQTVIQCKTVRQPAEIRIEGKDYLRSGDKCKVQFTFLNKAEYIRVGSVFMFRDGKTKGRGVVTSLTQIEEKPIETIVGEKPIETIVGEKPIETQIANLSLNEADPVPNMVPTVSKENHVSN